MGRQGVRRGATGHELRSNDAHGHQRGPPSLEDLAHLLADPLERVEATALDFGRQHLDFDPRKMLRQRSPPAGWWDGNGYSLLCKRLRRALFVCRSPAALRTGRLPSIVSPWTNSRRQSSHRSRRRSPRHCQRAAGWAPASAGRCGLAKRSGVGSLLQIDPQVGRTKRPPERAVTG